MPGDAAEAVQGEHFVAVVGLDHHPHVEERSLVLVLRAHEVETAGVRVVAVAGGVVNGGAERHVPSGAQVVEEGRLDLDPVEHKPEVAALLADEVVRVRKLALGGDYSVDLADVLGHSGKLNLRVLVAVVELAKLDREPRSLGVLGVNGKWRRVRPDPLVSDLSENLEPHAVD